VVMVGCGWGSNWRPEDLVPDWGGDSHMRPHSFGIASTPGLRAPWLSGQRPSPLWRLSDYSRWTLPDRILQRGELKLSEG
jgi:hypothetical protein